MPYVVKGIVSWNKMTFWRFHCIAENFLMRLDLKIYVLIIKLNKYRVRRVIHSLILVIDKYRYGENQVANPN
jgi:hypothetical protein